MADLRTRVLVEKEKRRRGITGRIDRFAGYRFEPIRYIIEKLGWHPWAGDAEHPGQIEVLQAYELALRQLHERNDFEQGVLTESQLCYWRPGQIVKNRIRIEAGHTVGKTKLASGILSHFFDTCTPSIIYSFAPTEEQINDLLWKEIRKDRRAARLPGRVQKKPRLDFGDDNPDHFAKGRATSGKDTEGIQGQHGKYLMFIVDEAEGVADYVFDAVESMTSGGIAIVLMLANPRTRSSQFYKQRSRPDVANFRVSCIYHPNVVAGKEIVPGAVRRDYVESMVRDHAEIADRHNEDEHTFELSWRTGTIYRPDTEFMFRVLGVAPSSLAEKSFFSTGRYEAACQRQPVEQDKSVARIGVDVARYGTDSGTIYCHWNGKAWRESAIQGQNTNVYLDALRGLFNRLKGGGVKDIQIRVDGGGGYASGIIDPLSIDVDVQKGFDNFGLFEVHNNGTPYDDKSYADLGTNIYAEAAESLKGVAIINPPPFLEEDLTERQFTYVNKSGRTVKRMVEKERFKDKHGRSPDDGDGFCLAVAPDFLFSASVFI